LLKIQYLEEKLETQLQLERVTDEKLTHTLSIQKSSTDKTGLGYVASTSDIPSTSKTVLKPLTTYVDKGKDVIGGGVLAQRPLKSLRPLEGLLYATIVV
jgi:hypothetical protein